MSTEPVPEADRQEQEEPPSHAPRRDHHHRFDQPEADVLEQEIPVGEDEDEEVEADDDRPL